MYSKAKRLTHTDPITIVGIGHASAKWRKKVKSKISNVNIFFLRKKNEESIIQVPSDPMKICWGWN